MEDVLVWLFWAAIIGGSIASSASKAKKRREEEAARQVAEAEAEAEARRAMAHQVASRQVTKVDYSGSDFERDEKPVGGAFGKFLEELSRQFEEKPSPPIVFQPLPRRPSQPAAQSVPAETSSDRYSSEPEYDMYDGRPYGGEYSVEDFDAESRYKGGEFGSRGGEFYSTTKTAAAATGEIARQAAADIAATEIAARDDLAEEGQSTTLRELLGGDFDLRRAIIETEILTPKYV